jgi:adenylate cyclase
MMVTAEPRVARLPSFGQRAAQLVLGPPLPERIPARVIEAIRREQDSSEILVSLVQVAAIVTFALLYSLSPKAFPPSVPFEPVPIALAVYGVFTLLRLAVATRRRLGPVFLAVSMILDITLLMVTIWSFYLQYQAPPAIYLKAPTLMYVFILISLRALRFEPWLVILGGATAIVGWLVLVAYAVAFDPGTMKLTHNYAVYVTSYSILLGAEFDKVISIGMVTAILAVALLRARKLLVRAVAEHQASADLSRFFAPEVASRIRATEGMLLPGYAEQREAAILFVDMRGFTTLTSRLQAKDVMSLLADYQDRVLDVVHRHGGSIDKFLGDGVLASFGATLPSPTYAADAMRAVEDLVEAGAQWRARREADGLPAPPLNGALACGAVMFGTVGNKARLEYTVIGEPVNFAAKLEKHCKIEGALAIATGETLDLATAQGFAPRAAWEHRATRRIDGVSQPLDLLVLGSAV